MMIGDRIRAFFGGLIPASGYGEELYRGYQFPPRRAVGNHAVGNVGPMSGYNVPSQRQAPIFGQFPFTTIGVRSSQFDITPGQGYIPPSKRGQPESATSIGVTGSQYDPMPQFAAETRHPVRRGVGMPVGVGMIRSAFDPMPQFKNETKRPLRRGI